MKNILSVLFFMLFANIILSQENWVVDNAHSNVRFEVGWEDFSIRTGEFKEFDGSIVSNSLDDLTKAKIVFTVNAESVDVISDRLFTRIISDKFLNTEVYPEIKFESSTIESTSDSTYVSTGLLKICGIEKDQEVQIEIKGQKETKKGEIFGIEVKLVVDRTDYNLTWGSPRLADKITIVGHLLYKNKNEAKTSR